MGEPPGPPLNPSSLLPLPLPLRALVCWFKRRENAEAGVCRGEVGEVDKAGMEDAMEPLRPRVVVMLMGVAGVLLLESVMLLLLIVG